MKSENQSPNPNLDQILAEIRNEQADSAAIEGAAGRVWARLAGAAEAGPEKIRGCADFQTMIPAYRSGHLSAPRRMLFEDHTHQCLVCRKALQAAGEVAAFPAPEKITRPAPVTLFWNAAPALRWAMAAAMLAAVGLAGWGVLGVLSMGPSFQGSRAVVQAAEGKLYRLSGQGLVPVAQGEALPPGAEVRTARDSRAVIRLKDGSLVEMRERSALSVTESASNLNVRFLDLGRILRFLKAVSESTGDLNVQLARGSVIVEAAKRGRLGGHLYVTTRDCRVSVTGTVFSVESGVKGSRVSVIEGEVRVSENDSETVLHPGEQHSTDLSMEPVSLREEFSWSRDADKHIALMREISELRKDLSRVPTPNMRYSSRVLGMLPASTALYFALPNIGRALGDAQQILRQRVEQSPVLQQWWSDKVENNAGQKFEQVINEVRAFSDYFGDEVVMTAALATSGPLAGHLEAPVFLAELKRSGFRDFAQSEVSRLGNPELDLAPDGKLRVGRFRFVDDPATAAVNPRHELLVWVHGDIVAMTLDVAALRLFAPGITAQAAGSNASPFHTRLTEAYREGVGVLFAADLESITANMPQKRLAALGNIKMLIVEQKESGGATDTSALLTFQGPRQGVFGWLARPSPIAALDFVSPQAAVVSAFAVDNPVKVINDILSWWAANDPNYAQDLAKAEAELGFSIQNDLASSLGSEFTFALDGPALPIPSWKIVVEVYDPQRLQWIFTKMEEAASRKLAERGKSRLQMSQETANGRIYYTVVLPDAQPVGEIHYVFAGGYLIAAPSRALLDSAIQNQATGNSLPRSQAFRSVLPRDRQANFSAIAYQNVGAAFSGIMESLSKGRPITLEQRQSLGSLSAEMKPTLVAAYAEEDHIVVTSNGLFGLSSGNLIGMSGPLGLFSLAQKKDGTRGK